MQDFKRHAFTELAESHFTGMNCELVKGCLRVYDSTAVTIVPQDDSELPDFLAGGKTDLMRLMGLSAAPHLVQT